MNLILQELRIHSVPQQPWILRMMRDRDVWSVSPELCRSVQLVTWPSAVLLYGRWNLRHTQRQWAYCIINWSCYTLHDNPLDYTRYMWITFRLLLTFLIRKYVPFFVINIMKCIKRFIRASICQMKQIKYFSTEMSLRLRELWMIVSSSSSV